MPVRQIALCEECGQHWLLTWTNGYGFGSYWLPVDKRISPRRAKRLLRKWSK